MHNRDVWHCSVLAHKIDIVIVSKVIKFTDLACTQSKITLFTTPVLFASISSILYRYYISISPLYLLIVVCWAFSTTGNKATWKTRQGTVTDSSNTVHGHDEVITSLT